MQNATTQQIEAETYRRLRWMLNRHGFSSSVQNDVCHLLNGLKWPHTSSMNPLLGNSGALLFHPTAGIVCRIQNKIEVVEHPLVLPRLRTFGLTDTHSLELCIGGNLNPTPSAAEARWVHWQLQMDGIEWQDSKKYNICHLPLRSDEYPDGLPVIMDREALCLFEDRQLQRRDYTDFGVPEIQSRIFREQINTLRRLLARACLKDAANPDSGLVDDFWQTAETLTTPLLAKKVTVQKPLVQGWGNPSEYLRDSYKVEQARLIFSSISAPPQKPRHKSKPNGPAPAPTAHHRPR